MAQTGSGCENTETTRRARRGMERYARNSNVPRYPHWFSLSFNSRDHRHHGHQWNLEGQRESHEDSGWTRPRVLPYGSRHIFSLLPSLPAHPPASIFTICRIWNLNRLGSDGKFPSLAISPGSFAANVDSRQGGSGEPGHLPREDLTSRTPYVVSCDYGNPR